MTHQKRLSAPKSWHIPRKENVFTVKTRPGPHNKDTSLPLVIMLRDILNVIKTTREAKRLLQENSIKVNGNIVKDHRLNVGIMDVLEIVPTKDFFLILFDELGRIVPKKVDKKIAENKIHKIKNKTIVKKKKTQLNFIDGSNLLVPKDTYKTGDSIILDKGKITKHLKLEKNALVYLIGGNRIGATGTVEEIKDLEGSKENIITIKIDKRKIDTLKKYAYVIEHKI